MTTYTQQELDEMEQENPGSTSKLTSVYISLDGGKTQYPLTYDSDNRMLTSPDFTPPQLSAVRELTHVVELYIGGELVMGKCVLWQIEPVALWQEGDVTATLRATDNETYLDYDYAENGAIFPEDAAFGIDYIIDPSLIPGPTFDEETFTTYQLDPDTASGYAEDALGQKIPVDETANFVWWTSDPSVATINEFGELTATGAAGEVKIYLTALNGNRDIETQNDDGTYVTGKCRTDYPVTYTYQDPEAAGGTTTTDTLVFGVGQTPFLTVGGSELTAAAGQDLTLIWTSNITAKNAANREDDTSATPFTVTLYHGDEQTWTWTYESTNANTIARATIPADYLTYDYENGSNSYQVTISAPYYYAEYGIASDVYCQTKDQNGAITGTNNNLYTGTIYRSSLASGEGDWTRSQRYPVNNLNLRRAAYAYVYLKNPDGTPYTGQINFRGGVYVDEEYRENAQFSLNTSADSNNSANQAAGNVDTPITVAAMGGWRSSWTRPSGTWKETWSPPATLCPTCSRLRPRAPTAAIPTPTIPCW